jgi:hypothetical protein
MNTDALANELNQLLATETRSLVRHLDEAKPYLSPKTYKAWHAVQQMGHVSEEHSHQLVNLFEKIERTPKAIAYPAEVANYHFLTLESMLPLLIEQKQGQIAAYRRAIEHAAGDPRVDDELAALLAENAEQLAQLESFQSSIGVGANSTAGRR